MKDYLWTAGGNFEAFHEPWKYGDLRATCLSPELENDSNKIEGVYKIECPDEVMHFCREIEKLGGRALLVGGSVRDTIISQDLTHKYQKPKDFDLEIYGIEPDVLMKILELNFEVSEADKHGKAFEVIKINIDGWDEPLDVSMPRLDSKTGDGHKDFEITACPWMNIKEAAMRRDVKMNSCAYDPLTEVLYDPYHGIENIHKRVIEVTDEVTFQEDPDRIYRIMQFAARFDFGVAEKTVELCKEMVSWGMLDKISIDRVVVEINKFMEKSIKPSMGMDFLLKTGVIEKYWKELFPLVGLKQNKDWHPEEFVWEHTLQVMDAAAEIADREGLEPRERRILIWAAMDHDLGKATTTSVDDRGKIISHGHEAAGVEPTMSLFARFAKPDEPKTGIEPDIRNAVAGLVKEHLRPKEIWIDVVKEGHKLKGQIRKLAYRLEKFGTNIYMLMLLAEADQRGRNGESNTPKKREEVEELIEWETWLAEKMMEQKVTKKGPERLLRGEVVKTLEQGKVAGPWVGVIMECVYLDQMEGIIDSVELANEKAKSYYAMLKERVARVALETSRPERGIWEEIKKAEDPRLYCQEL